MSNYPGVTSTEMRADIVPAITTFLEKHGLLVRTELGDRGLSGHEIHAFGSGEHGEAYAVFEGNSWAEDFVEEMDGGIEVGDRVYEIEAWSSYEITVVILDDYRKAV